MSESEMAGSADGADAPRILLYTQDSLGLGHLRRATTLANELIGRRKDASVLLAVDSPVAPFFELDPHIDFLKLPTIVKVDAGVFSSGRLRISYERISRIRARLLEEIVLQFAPHVLLVDHMPGGANRELMPALEALRRTGSPTKVVLGLRDIIDRPSVTRSVWDREGVYRTLEDHYQEIMIYGSRGIFATAEEYGIADTLGSRVRYCGYVCNGAQVEDPQDLRERLGIEAKTLVTVTVGGGADALRLVRTYFDALEELNWVGELATLLVAGPFFPAEELRALRARAERLGIRVFRSVGDGLAQINAADVVVGMAGYNTLSEILRFRKPAVIVPRAGPSAEQGMRARLFAERGWIEMVEPDALGARTLADALERALGRVPESPSDPGPDLGGVSRATECLLAALSANGSSSPARPVHEAVSEPASSAF